MLFDALIVGSVSGYVVHRVHIGVAEAFSEMIWVLLGAISAVLLYEPVATAMSLGGLVGSGLANLIGFLVIVSAFVALRMFFVASHRHHNRQMNDSSNSTSPGRSIHWAALPPTLVSAVVTLTLSLMISASLSSTVLIGFERTIDHSSVAQVLLHLGEPIQPLVTQLVSGAWVDLQELVSR